MRKQVFIKVHGFVQGIFFRQTAKEKADSLKLTGYAKNNFDGSVEILACGEEENLKKLIEWAKIGPSSAHVDKIETKWQKYTGKFSNFEIKY